ncbi:uncharacterized protein LOC125230724 [Leguminivora glycinivorella]|uniref:uncharacterized protein LOC125230724 n=1 Tax=Leguminivora glycinivorella TaxID=1035111 RepID=UPI00200C5DF5|nr:uncharacterized protein LOC125230724 [Leguminivora glycinivorella]
MLRDITACWDRIAMGRRTEILGRLRVQMCAILSSVLIFPLLLIVTYNGSISVWKKVLVTVTFILPELIQFAMISFYLIMILMIVALLKNIEEEITILDLINNTTVGVRSGMSLFKIKNVYVKTLKMKRRVVAALQAPLLVTMAVTFHELEGLPHMICHGRVYVQSFSLNNTIELSLWSFMQLLKISELF